MRVHGVIKKVVRVSGLGYKGRHGGQGAQRGGCWEFYSGDPNSRTDISNTGTWSMYRLEPNNK